MTDLYLKIIIRLILCAVILVYFFKVMRPFEGKRRKWLARYWSRSCTGSEWRRVFPGESKDSIRSFLECFVDGFAFSSRKIFNFSPNDKIMDIYNSLYPAKGWPDALELETFAINLEREYSLNLAGALTDELTLGQLFLMAIKENPNQKLHADG